jgi:hypothetical protein
VAGKIRKDSEGKRKEVCEAAQESLMKSHPDPYLLNVKEEGAWVFFAFDKHTVPVCGVLVAPLSVRVRACMCASCQMGIDSHPPA